MLIFGEKKELEIDIDAIKYENEFKYLLLRFSSKMN